MRDLGQLLVVVVVDKEILVVALVDVWTKDNRKSGSFPQVFLELPSPPFGGICNREPKH